MLTCGGYSSWGGFSACIHSLCPLLCDTKNRSSIICQHNSPLGRTAELQIKNPFLPSLTHCQLLGKAILHLQAQPLVTRATGTQSGSPSPLHTWGLSPARTPRCAISPATPATEAAPVLHRAGPHQTHPRAHLRGESGQQSTKEGFGKDTVTSQRDHRATAQWRTLFSAHLSFGLIG